MDRQGREALEERQASEETDRGDNREEQRSKRRREDTKEKEMKQLEFRWSSLLPVRECNVQQEL